MVKTLAETSTLHMISLGVPQGSILGPLLFTLYVNDLPEMLSNCKAVLYADDTTLYTSSKHPSNIQVHLNEDLSRLEMWFKENKLTLNTEKSEYMVISNIHLRKRFRNIKIKVGNKLMEDSSAIKILGVTITSNLTWDNHIKNLINNLKYCYRSFRRSCRFLSTDSRKMLYNAVIASRMNYCDMIWDKCSVSSRNKLQSIQNRCARTILGSRPGTSAPPLLQQLGWITLEDKRKIHKCVLMHRLLNGRGPKVLLDRLCNYINTRPTGIPTRNTTSNSLVTVAHNTNYLAKSYFYDTMKIWNSLPTTLRQIENSTTFKDNLQKHLLHLGR